MSNKRISELSVLTSASIEENDLLLVNDVTDKESKQLDINNLGLYLANKYKVKSAINSDYSEISEYSTKACNADKADFAISASGLTRDYYNVRVRQSDTSSIALLVERTNTASYCHISQRAITSSYSDVAQFAYGVIDSGIGIVDNSRYAQSSSISDKSLTASAIEGIPNIQSLLSNLNNIVISTGGGNAVATSSVSFFSQTSSVAFNSRNAQTASVANFAINANNSDKATSANTALFANTASMAYTASYIKNFSINNSFNWVNPTTILTINTHESNDIWQTLSLSSICPPNTWVIVVNLSMIKTYSNCSKNTSVYFTLRKSSITNENYEYNVFPIGSGGGIMNALWIPVSKNNTIDYKKWIHESHWELKMTLIGYISNG